MRDTADGDINIILGGLLSVTPPTSPAEQASKRTVSEFLHQMGPYGRNDYEAIALHPYAFKTNSGGAPVGPNGVGEVRDKVRSNIKTTREALNDVGGTGKDIWITELGWPTENKWDTTHPAVDFPVQRELIESTFEMIQANWQNFGIRNVFYYNIQDILSHPYGVNTNAWDYRSGLRGASGNYKPGWYGFQTETGVSKWPVKPKANTNGTAKKSASKATVSATVNPYGSPTSYRFKWDATTSYGQTTSWQGAGFEEGDASVSSEIAGLQNEKTYHYRVVAINENGETEEGEDRQFTTAPNTDTYIEQPVGVLHGNPGYVTVRGGVSSSEGLVDNTYVHLNFLKKEGGEFKLQYTRTPLVHNGVYEEKYWTVGEGEWEVKAVFPGQGNFDKSESGYHPFTIRDGYQFINTNSGKCLDIAYESPHNAAQAWQYECHSPVRSGQVFSLKPVGFGDDFQIIARNSSKCVDVRNDNQVAGEQLEQWACANPIPSVQIWNRFGGSNGWNFKIQHSGQCMDVHNSGTTNAHKIDQWPCNGTNAQGWQLKAVDAPLVPTKVTASVSEILHGEPGLVSVEGDLDVSGYPLTGKWVNIIYKKKENGVFVQKDNEGVSAESGGHFGWKYRGLGPGTWKVRVVYYGDNPLAESEVETPEFVVKKGYRLVNKVSGKCLSISENKPDDGTPAIQWSCSENPQAGDGQLFTWFPAPGHYPYYQIRFNEPGGNNNGKCLEVNGFNQSDGVQLVLWGCVNGGQDNQLWKGEGAGGEYFRFRIKHSDKCMDNWTSGMNNGNKIVQWPCNGTDAQRWKWQAIG